MTAPELFSTIHLTSPDQELPDPANGPYFVATKDGYMICQNTHWGRTLVPVKENPGLAETPSLFWHDMDLPPHIIGQAWGFFRAVFEKQRSEAMVDITWSAKHGYRLFVPSQETTGGGVHAKRTADHYRGRIVGTIHSHCDFQAYHSGTDTHDADGHDGLHMTIGHVTSDNLDIAVMHSANGKRWEDLKLTDVVKDPSAIHPIAPPDWWMKLVDRPKPKPVTPSESKYNGNHTGRQMTTWVNTQRPATPGSHIIIGGTPKPTPQNRRPTFNNLDALAYSLNMFDPRIELLDAIQQQIDEITSALDEIGIDFDYEVAAASYFETDAPNAADDIARLRTTLQNMETREP